MPGTTQQKIQGTLRPAAMLDAYKAQLLKEPQVVHELREAGLRQSPGWSE